MTAANLDIVTKLFNLDNGTFGTEVIRRWDGTPATPDEVDAVRAARLPELEATLELHRLALEQSKYELDRKVRLNELTDKYRRPGDTGSTRLAVFEDRMSPQDRAEWDRLWDELGNFIVLRGTP